MGMRGVILGSLVVANLGFAWLNYAGRGEAGMSLAELRALEINPEQVRIINPDLPGASKPPALPAELPKLPPLPNPPKPAEVKADPIAVPALAVPEPAAPLPEAVAAAPRELAADKTASCRQWAAFFTQETAKVEALLRGAGFQDGAWRQIKVDVFWVFVPRLQSQAAADQLAAQLRAARETDFSIAREGSEWRLSLGVFRHEDSARARLQRIQAIGIQDAVMAPRGTRSSIAYLIQAEAGSDALRRLEGLAKGYAGTQIKPAPCNTP